MVPGGHVDVDPGNAEILERQLAEVDADLDTRIRTSPVRSAKSDLLQSLPGVGPNLSRTLIAELPERNAMVRDGRSSDPDLPFEQLKLQHSC
jgi:transposase